MSTTASGGRRPRVALRRALDLVLAVVVLAACSAGLPAAQPYPTAAGAVDELTAYLAKAEPTGAKPLFTDVVFFAPWAIYSHPEPDGVRWLGASWTGSAWTVVELGTSADAARLQTVTLGAPAALVTAVFGPEPLSWPSADAFSTSASALLAQGDPGKLPTDVAVWLRRRPPGYSYLPAEPAPNCTPSGADVVCRWDGFPPDGGTLARIVLSVTLRRNAVTSTFSIVAVA
jgi:hypothetical protein